jgi:hypothetical protein
VAGEEQGGQRRGEQRSGDQRRGGGLEGRGGVEDGAVRAAELLREAGGDQAERGGLGPAAVGSGVRPPGHRALQRDLLAGDRDSHAHPLGGSGKVLCNRTCSIRWM